MSNILLTFTGFHDPYSKSLVGQEEQRGPVLSLVAAQPFDRVILLSTPATEAITEATQDELAKLRPGLDVESRHLPLSDPTDYRAILTYLRQHIGEVQHEHPDASFFLAVASGTPQMHAAWVLLAAGGEIPAKIIHIRPPRFVTRDQPLVSEVDLTSEEFPSVRARIAMPAGAPDEVAPELGVVVRQLSIVGDHPSIKAALEVAAALSASNAPVLIRGETGTGKELFARSSVWRIAGSLRMCPQRPSPGDRLAVWRGLDARLLITYPVEVRSVGGVQDERFC